jgi:hypothetical protein
LHLGASILGRLAGGEIALLLLGFCDVGLPVELAIETDSSAAEFEISFSLVAQRAVAFASTCDCTVNDCRD